MFKLDELIRHQYSFFNDDGEILITAPQWAVHKGSAGASDPSVVLELKDYTVKQLSNDSMGTVVQKTSTTLRFYTATVVTMYKDPKKYDLVRCILYGNEATMNNTDYRETPEEIIKYRYQRAIDESRQPGWRKKALGNIMCHPQHWWPQSNDDKDLIPRAIAPLLAT